MKRIILYLLTTTLLSATSCEKTEDENMKVVKDCTGIYLQKDGKDYHVCNIEKLKTFTNGQDVVASYTRIEKCTSQASDQIVCMMYHRNEGWIKVKDVK